MKTLIPPVYLSVHSVHNVSRYRGNAIRNRHRDCY